MHVRFPFSTRYHRNWLLNCHHSQRKNKNVSCFQIFEQDSVDSNHFDNENEFNFQPPLRDFFGNFHLPFYSKYCQLFFIFLLTPSMKFLVCLILLGEYLNGSLKNPPLIFLKCHIMALWTCCPHWIFELSITQK